MLQKQVLTSYLPKTLGLTVLDEPSATQSDPSVLELQLRVVTKQSASKTARIKRVRASEDSSAVEKWIRDISDLHRSKPPPSVHYQKTMPDIDNLMQVCLDAALLRSYNKMASPYFRPI